jgi:hypothetical protein
MKIFSVVLTALLVQAACILVFSCASSKGAGSGEAVEGAWTWGTFTDAANKGSSRVSLVEDIESINGDPKMTYSINGEITNQYEYGYAGWYAFPDDPTAEALKEAKSFSFKVIGDGQTYFVMVSTSDITDACYHRVTFTTKKDQEQTVTVRMGSLQQPEDWGIRKRFNQQYATQVQWQTTNNGKPGTFKLKIWDLNLYK